MSTDYNSSSKSFWPVKTALKEKIVVLYDALLNVCMILPLCFILKYTIDLQGDQPWLNNGHYWDDFFLLKVNAKHLLEEVERAYVDKSATLKVIIFIKKMI